MKRHLLLHTITLVSLAGCTAQDPQAAPSPEPMPEQRLEQVQSRAAQTRSVVEVKPLTAPEVSVLMADAAAADRAGQGAQARSLLEEALSLAPQDPAVWQHYAELSLKHGDFEAAIEAAEQSYAVGPQVGELCSRNWLTIAEAQTALGRNDAAADAATRSESCPVRARERI